MKRLAVLAFLLAGLSTWAFGQWNFAGYFPDSTFAKKATGVHGIAVDPAGKVWVQWYGRTDSLPDPGAGGQYFGVLCIYVFNPDGSQAPFSPMRVLQGPGVNDTLWTAPSARAVTNRGLRRDHTGNILISIFDRVYRVNYQTGVVMNKVVAGNGAAITAVAVDTLGEFFVQTVVPGNPIRIYAPNFTYLGNVTDTSRGFCRSTVASKEGNDFFSANYTLHCVYRYHSDFGTFGPYTVGPNDTLMKGFDCESIEWNPTRTRLWASAGSANDRPNRYPGANTNYSLNTWYAFDPNTWSIVDSIKWHWYNTDSVNTRPRAIAFSPDGNTAYVGCFGAGTYPSLEKFTRTTSVQPDPSVVPETFTLSQNYPNPFNPSTEIKFTLLKGGYTTLKVYNTLGQVVSTLVDEYLDAGAYTVRFSMPQASSGTYVYRLTSNGQSLSKKMMLLK